MVSGKFGCNNQISQRSESAQGCGPAGGNCWGAALGRRTRDWNLRCDCTRRQDGWRFDGTISCLVQRSV